LGIEAGRVVARVGIARTPERIRSLRLPQAEEDLDAGCGAGGPVSAAQADARDREVVVVEIRDEEIVVVFRRIAGVGVLLSGRIELLMSNGSPFGSP
jgi:hypothetical protein